VTINDVSLIICHVLYELCVCIVVKTMSNLELVSYITEENKRREKRRIVLTELYLESVVLGLAYLSSQRPPRNVGCFSSDEQQLQTYRKYLLKEMYDGSEVTCYDKLRLTK
jgi:hypothetical protein